MRRLYDLHKLAGIAGEAVLVVVVGTGALLELPDQAPPVIGNASPRCRSSR